MEYESARQRSRMVPLDLAGYLEKLQVQKEKPSFTFLKRLHKAHLLHIPIENLDFHLGRVLPLDVISIQKKVLEKRRGGVSYELNGLFFQLLLNLGFDCHLISASFPDKHSWGPDFEHIAILVRLETEKWLVDIGFGDCFIEPKSLQPNVIQVDYNSYYKFDQDPDGNWILSRTRDLQEFTRIYRFSQEPKEYIEFIPRWLWHQSGSSSAFKKEKMITQLFNSGRVTLTDRALLLFYKGEKEVHPIRNEDEFLAKLNYHFGVDGKKISPFI